MSLPAAADADTAPEIAVEIADLLLALEDPVAARAWFERAVALDGEDADAWHGIGLCAELAGDEEAKRRAWLQTLDLDIEQEEDLPELLSEKQTAEVAEAALTELPSHARGLLANVPILIADRPARTDVAGGCRPPASGPVRRYRLSGGLFAGRVPPAHPDPPLPAQPRARGRQRGGAARGGPNHPAARNRPLLRPERRGPAPPGPRLAGRTRTQGIRARTCWGGRPRYSRRPSAAFASLRYA